jgi:hypothetical protein
MAISVNGWLVHNNVYKLLLLFQAGENYRVQARDGASCGHLIIG